MYIQTISKQERFKKFTSCFLIVLIGFLGFPFSVFSSPNPDATQAKPSQVKVTPIEPDKGVVASDSVQDSSVNESKEHFAVIEEFKIDKGFWFTLFAISELSKQEKGNNQTAFNATPIAFSLTGSGISPTYTIINKGAKVQTVNRDNLTGKLSLPDGKSILTEAINQTLTRLSSNNVIRQGDWEENVTISLKEYTGIRSFEVPVRFKTEPIKDDKSLFRISFESESFDFSLKSNSSIKQNMKGFTIVGAENKKVYFSVFRYEGDCSQYENGYQSDHFVGQQIGYLTNPENGKALLDSIDKGGFNQLLNGYPMINLSSGSFRDKALSLPDWMGKVLGMSRLLQASTLLTADKSSDFATITTSVGGHIIDGLWSLAFNTSSFLKELATGNRQDAPVSEVTNRLLDSKISFIRNLYEGEKDTQGWIGTAPQIEIIDPSVFECYSKIGGDASGLQGDLLAINKDNWALLKRDSQGKYSGIEESVSRFAGNLQNTIQKNLWGKNPFGKTSLITDGYGRIGQDLIIKQVEVARSIKTENGVGKNLKPVVQNPDNPGEFTEKYITTQTIEYAGKGKQYRTRSINISAMDKQTDNENRLSNYKLWIMGQVMEPKMDDNKSFYGPIEFSRKLDDEIVSFKTKGFYIIEQVLNQTIVQVKRYNPRKNTWKEKIAINFAGEYLPQNFEYNLSSNIVDYGNNNLVLIIQYESSPFTFKSLEDNVSFVQCHSKGIAVYSLDKERLYQHTFKFEADLNGESILVEELGYLSNNNAKSIIPILDVCKTLTLAERPIKVENQAELPGWALQSILAQQISSTAGFGIGERGTNPTIGIATIGYTAETIVKDGWQILLDKLKEIWNQTYNNALEKLDAINDAYTEYHTWCKANKPMVDFVKTVGNEGIDYLLEDNPFYKTKNLFNFDPFSINYSGFVHFIGEIIPCLRSAVNIYGKAEILIKVIEINTKMMNVFVNMIESAFPPISTTQTQEISKKPPKPKSPLKPIIIGAGIASVGALTARIAGSKVSEEEGGYYSFTLWNLSHNNTGDIVSLKIDGKEYMTSSILEYNKNRIINIPKKKLHGYTFFFKTRCGWSDEMISGVPSSPFKIYFNQIESWDENLNHIILCHFVIEPIWD